MYRPTLLTAAVCTSIALFSAPAFAVDEYNVSKGVTTAGTPLGAHGVDVVDLAKDASVVSGHAKFTTVHDGVSYYFATAETQKMFEDEPNAYLPQFGGFCAFAVALGKKFDGDPRYADIVDGKLYVFVNEAIFAKYKEDTAGTIAKAYELWPGIESVAVSDL